MSEELFEKYLQNSLSEEEKGRLSELLADENGKRAFAEFVQEWSLLGEVAREMTATSGETSRIRPRLRTYAPARQSAWGWWAAGLAASLAFVLGLLLVMKSDPAPAAAPSATAVPAPPAAPKPEPRRAIVKAPEREPVPAPREIEKPRAPKPLPAPPKPDPVVKAEPEKTPVPVAPKPAPKAPAPVPDAVKPRKTVAAIAVLSEVDGDVRVVSEGKEFPARTARPFLAAEGLRVGPGSRAVLRFPDKTVLEFASGTIVNRIVRRDQAGRTATGKTVDLAKGSVTADVVRQPVGRPLVIRSPQAEATVLGTTLAFSADADSATLEVWKGRVRLKRRADGQSIIVTGGHRGIVAPRTPLRPEVIVLTREFQDGLHPDASYAGTRDTHINQVKPDENVGRVDELESDGSETAGKSIWTLLRWDISSIPKDAVIQSVIVTLNVEGTSKSASGYRLYGARRPWIETEATWKEYAAGRPWRSPGARSVVDRHRSRLGEFAPRLEGPIGILLNADGAALVQSWVRAPEKNFGLLIGSNASDGFTFDSREASKPPRRPRLTVTYTLGARR